MKEYINRLARGKFTYQRPELEVQDYTLTGSVTAGGQGMFTFRFTASQPAYGIVLSSHARVRIEKPQFGTTPAEIVYTVDAADLKEGTVIQGQFYIVSSAGEKSVSYEYTVEAQKVMTSMGAAGSMFHFANLVQTSPEEAAGFFLSPDFKRIFLKNDPVQTNIYDVVKGAKNGSEANVYAAMEEFLIAVRKKSPVGIDVFPQTKTFADFTESVKERITITRSGWGYTELTVETDVPFICPKITRITSENFTGNKYELEYVIDADKLHAGRNWGRMTICSFTQKYTVEIEVDCAGQENTHREKKQAALALVQEYLKFRMKREDKRAWQDKSLQIIERMRGICDDDIFFKLAQAQILLVQNRSDEAGWLIDNVRDFLEENKDSHVELYCYYLYVSAIYYKDKSYTFAAVKVIRDYYENGYDTWRVLWVLFYLDAAEDANKSIKLLRIKDAYHNGCVSPVMYYEALQILNAQPELLRVLNDFELHILQFGCKYGIISTKLTLYVCEMIANGKVADMQYLRLLKALNDFFDKDEILTVLVTHMIRNELIGPEYAGLYEKGILRGLRITRLYEFYIESLDKKELKRLPQIVLRYFTYESSLSTKSKAYLYADILKNHSSSREIMNTYAPQIERFAYGQMKKGYIDPYLEVIYGWLFQNVGVNEETAPFLSRYLFTYRITVFNDKIESVLVKHKELRKGQRCTLVGRTAYVQMYTRDCILMFEDAGKQVHKGSIQYEIERVYDNPAYLKALDDYCSKDIYLLLNWFEQSLEQRKNDEEACAVCLALMADGNVNQITRNRLNSWQIQYYHEYYHGEDFGERYEKILKEELQIHDAALLIETCIAEGMYEDAFDLVCEYGFEEAAPAKLLRMARNMILLRPQEYNEKLLACCIHVFDEGKYDENVLAYLEQFYQAKSDKMMKVWRACAGFRVPCQTLAERILVERLFTGNLSGRIPEVFTYYRQQLPDAAVEMAYLAENAYRYFVKHETADEQVFTCIGGYLLENKKMPPVCGMAYLKYHTQFGQEQLGATHMLLLQKLMDMLCAENIFFSFYEQYKGILSLPYNAADKTTVEYYAPENSKVQIFYRHDDKEEYQSEVLSCVAGGVYAKSFSLFYGESIQYYFLEDDGKKKKKTQDASLLCNNVTPKEPQGRFDYLNDMLVSMEMHDMATMKKLMQGYCVQDYVVEQMFQPF